MDFLVEHYEIAVAVWAVLFISDLLLTLKGARLLKQGAGKYFQFEGSYELNPFHQKQIDQLKTFSPRFFAALILSSGLLGFLGWYNRGPGQVPHATEFALGAMYLIEAAIHVRHFRNIYSFRRVIDSEGAAGTMRVSRSLSYGVSSVEFAAYGVLFLGLFWLTDRAFFLGGCVTCLLTAAKDAWHSKKHLATAIRSN